MILGIRGVVMRITLTIAAAALCALAATGARTASHKPLDFPIRDVAVQMRTVNSLGDVQFIQTFFLTSEKKSRAIFEDSGMYLLADYNARITTHVFRGQPPTYIVMPMEEEPEYVFTGQKETIAGYECINWRTPVLVRTIPTTKTYFERVTDCITTDGVVLRSVVDAYFDGKERQTISEATKVRYERQEPSLFRLPVDAVRK
jgi:hypothetical protein